MYILVVEDNDAARAALVSSLERMGHKTCWSANGEGALGLLRTEHVDVMLLDLDLGPGIDGWEVARRKARDVDAAHIPIIVTTGLNLADVHSHGNAHPLAGAILMMGKPLDMKELESNLNRIAQGKGV